MIILWGSSSRFILELPLPCQLFALTWLYYHHLRLHPLKSPFFSHCLWSVSSSGMLKTF
jgi:hypothetical protein